MPKWLKVVLGVALGGSLLCCMGFSAMSMWLRGNADELREKVGSSQQAGRFFGKNRDSEACLQETLARVNRCGRLDIPCQMSSQGFLQACLSTGTLSPESCKGAPPRGELLRSAAWTAERCQQLDPANVERCRGMLKPLLTLCTR